MTQELYTVQETAEILNCNTHTVLKAIHSNRLPATKVDGDYWISRHDLDEYCRILGGGNHCNQSAAVNDTEPELKLDRERVFSEIIAEIQRNTGKSAS